MYTCMLFEVKRKYSHTVTKVTLAFPELLYLCGCQLAIIHGTVLALAHLFRIVWIVWWEVWTPLVLQCDIDWPSSGPTACSVKSIVFGGWRWRGPAQDPQQPNRSCLDLRLRDTKWGMIRTPNVIAPDYGYKRWSTNREACHAYIQPEGMLPCMSGLLWPNFWTKFCVYEWLQARITNGRQLQLNWGPDIR